MARSANQSDLNSTTALTAELGEPIFSTVCVDGSRAGFLLGVVVLGTGLITLLLLGLLKRELSGVECHYFALIGTFALGVGGIIIWVSKLHPPSFCWYQHAVQYVKGTAVLTLHFDQIGGFTYDALRTTVHGVYSHSTVKLRFDPIDTSCSAISATIIYRKTGADEALPRLRNSLASTLADRMRTQLRQGQSVVWTSPDPTFILHPSVLDVQDSKDNDLVSIPFDQISGYNAMNGVLQIYSERLHKPALLNSSAPNFYPGLILLFRLANIPQVPISFWERLIGTR